MTPFTDDNQKLQERIGELKRKRNAILLAHNYQRPEVQDVADFTGDSLELSRIAADTDVDVIVFCGVHFMAESAAILSPDKTVLLPAEGAYCPMAAMVTVQGIREVPSRFPGYAEPFYADPPELTLRDLKKRHPGVPVVAYVNTTAAVKAESDYCCTSANAVKVVEAVDGERIICIPDRNLAAWIARNTNKEIIAWDGFCHVHDRIRAEDVQAVRDQHPGSFFMAHPECRIEVCELADLVTSTSGMLRFARESAQQTFIVGTETGIMHRLRKDSPDKVFHALRADMVCPNMKKTTLRGVVNALENNETVVTVPEDIRIAARKSLDRMLAIL